MNEFVLFIVLITGAFDRSEIIEMPMEKQACIRAESTWRAMARNTSTASRILVWCYQKKGE